MARQHQIYNGKKQRPASPVPGMGDGIIRQLTAIGPSKMFTGDPTGGPLELQEALELWARPQVAERLERWYHSDEAVVPPGQPVIGPKLYTVGKYGLPTWMACYLLSLEPGEIPATEPLDADKLPNWTRGIDLDDGSLSLHNSTMLDRFPAVCGRHEYGVGIVRRLVLEGIWPPDWADLDNDQLRLARQEMAS